MPNCPSCNAQLDDETLVPQETSVCPSCGATIELDGDDIGLSSFGGGSPADATMRVDPGSESSLSGSSLAGSQDLSDDLSSHASQDDATLDSGLPDGTFDSAMRSAEPDSDATLAIGGGWDEDDDDDEDFQDTDFEVDEFEDDSAAADEGTYLSLDATIDLCNWMPRSEVDAPSDDGPSDSSDDQTILLGDADDALGLSDDEPLGLGGQAGAYDLTMMVDGDSDPEATPPAPSKEPDATLPVDSERARSGQADSSKEPGSAGTGSSLSDSSVDRTESPSSVPNDATLAFDTERRSSDANAPEPLNLTGLDSGGTIPRGPLGDGRASASLKPGASLVVGDESVRLRVSTVSDPDVPVDGGIDFAIENVAGKGGMGVVYKARQQSLNRSVAIKQIKAEGASDSDRNKFVSEAVITGQLEHPNIAPVHDLGLAPDGLPFYAMKFLVGSDWGDSIKDNTLDENLNILIQVAQAIAFAHSKQVLHRDLKPDNVWLGSFGEVLVIDWGLAARLDDGSEIQPAGTPIYMPPETALEYLDYAKGRVVGGKKVESSRRRIPAGEYCDIYLLGALLFKIVTGRAPHRGKSTFECLRNAAKNEIVKTRRKGELLSIAYKAMATEPEERHATATEFIDALKSYQSHAQSIQIAKSASSDLREAGRLIESGTPAATKLYALFSSAQNGYKNALDLWDGNRKAQRRLARSQRMFAETAYANGDFDLALSLLDGESSEDTALRTSITADQKSRKARLAWFKTLQYATAASLLVALGFIGYSFALKQTALQLGDEIAQQTEELDKKEALANQKEKEAAAATQLAAEQKTEAAKQKAEAVRQKGFAEENKAQATLAINEAAQAEERSIKAERLADEKVQEAQRAAAIATAKTAEAERQSYYAALSGLKATLAEDGVFAAWKRLQGINPRVAAFGADDPEWRFLVNAVEWHDEATELVGENPAAGTQPTFAAASAEGRWEAVVSPAAGGSQIAVYRDGEAKPAHVGRVPAPPAAAAIDSSGRYVAIAGSPLVIFDTKRGESLRMGKASSAATCLSFHPTRPELLVGAPDSGVARWSLAEGAAKLIEADDQWHQAAVTAVGYSPDGQQRFSSDATGRLIVWRSENGTWSDRKAVRHTGAGSPEITTAAITSDPKGRLAYGCVDGSAYEVVGWWDAPLTDEGYAAAIDERLTTSHSDQVTSVSYASDGDTIISSGGDTILVRAAPLAANDAKSARRAVKRERRYHETEVLSCTPTPEGVVLSSDDRGRVLRWKLDVEPDEDTFSPEGGRGAGVAAVRLESDPTGERIVVADRDGFVRTWDDLRRPGASETEFTGHADHRDLRAWRLDGPTPQIVTVAADNQACLWRERDGLLQRTIALGDRPVVAVDTQNAVLYASTDGRPTESGVAAVAFQLNENSPAVPLWTESPRVSALHPLGKAGPDGATLAVGLRDGQVYLWGPRSGRTELVRSSGRPHWRPITALTFDRKLGRLYSGDRAGLLTSWDLLGKAEPRELRLESSAGTIAPVVKIIPWSGGRLVVARRGESGIVATVLDRGFTRGRANDLPARGLRDLAIDPNGVLVGLRRVEGVDRLATWNGPAAGWADLATSADRLNGVAATADGWLSWGPGVVEWRPTRDGLRVLASRIVSRPATSALVSTSAHSLQALTQIGTIDQWSRLDNEGTQERLGFDGQLSASVVTPQGDEAFLALATAAGTTRIEHWSLLRRERLAVVADGQPGRCSALVVQAEIAIAAFGDRVVVLPLGGGAGEVIRLPEGTARPNSLALSADSSTIALTTADGSAFLASKPDGRWQLGRLDREGISSVAFTPAGDRLLLGLASGRVVLAEPRPMPDGSISARLLLTFDGHSDPVTVLQVADTQDGARIVSGDAAGRVVVRSL